MYKKVPRRSRSGVPFGGCVFGVVEVPFWLAMVTMSFEDRMTIRLICFVRF
jgi:hypothetical protein